MMRSENSYFDVYPRIVRAGNSAAIHIHPLFDHVRFIDGETYDISIQPMEETGFSKDPIAFKAQPIDGDLIVNFQLDGEQEFILQVQRTGNENKKRLSHFHIYAVADDLFSLTPYKGDLHMHSNASDGLESPAYVAAACREIGMDFIAITDHRQYAPSLTAIQAFSGVDTDFRLFPGEEVHPPENRVHMINFGGKYSVNEMFKTDGYRAEVQAIEDGLAGFPPGLLRYQYVFFATLTGSIITAIMFLKP
jgi:hypothetical protein